MSDLAYATLCMLPKVHTIIKWIRRTDNEMAQKWQRFADDTVNQLCYNSYAGNYEQVYYDQCQSLLLLGGNTVA